MPSEGSDQLEEAQKNATVEILKTSLAKSEGIGAVELKGRLELETQKYLNDCCKEENDMFYMPVMDQI